MLKTVKNTFKKSLSHQKIQVFRNLANNITYPPFLYTSFAQNLTLILGCQRSGNTLTYLMLNCHPSVRGIDESDSNYRLPNIWHLYSQSKKNCVTALKFPGQTHNLEYYVNNLSTSKIIWPVRNPYAVVSSMLKWQQKEGNWIKVYAKGELWQYSFLFPEILKLDLDSLDEVSLGAYIWKYKEKTLQLYQQSKLKVFSFQYEHLLENSAQTMKNMLSFLELEWSENVLHHENYYKSEKRYPGGTKGSNALDKSRKKPQLILSTPEIESITTICYEEMQPYGYEKKDLMISVSE